MAKPKRPQQNTHQNGRQAPSRSAAAGAARTGASRPATTGSTQQRTVRTSATSPTTQTNKPQAAGGTTQGNRAVSNGAAKGASEASRRYQPLAARAVSRGASKRKSAHQAWWQKNLPVLVAGVTVVLLIGIIVLIAHNASGNTGPAGIGDPAPASVTDPLTQAPASLYASVGTGGLPSPFSGGVSGNHIGDKSGGIAKGSDGKPVFFYAGAEYCPYCAAERWSMVMALSRFGTISNLHLSASTGTDVYPNTPTFTFLGSSYSSNTIDFSSVEETDRDQNALQTPTAQQGQYLKFNGQPYLKDNGIPFLNVANQYVANGSGYSPGALDNMTWQDIANKIKSNPSDTVTQDIVGNANYITAAICQTTGQQPASVCKAAPIPDVEKKL